jgi:hydroxyacylglutathione hydrolase
MKRIAWVCIALLACAAQSAAQTSGPPTLTGLELGADKSDLERLSIRLNETFSPLLLEYTATVEASYTQTLFITPSVSGQPASLTINGSESTPGTAHPVPLALGENRFTIVVGSGGGARSYRLTITRKDLSKEYWSEPLGKGVWRIQDFGGYVGNEDMYLVEGATRALLFDTGMGKGDLAGYVRTLTRLPVDVAITHGHRDHFGQLDQFPEATVYVTGIDATRLPAEWLTPRVRPVRGGDVIDIGAGRKFEIVPMPGHSLGSILFVDMANKIAVTGDAVSSGSMVYMFGSACTALDQYRDALKKAEERFERLDGLTLLVGHHYQEKTPLKGAAGKQLIADMRTAADRVLSGRLEGTPARTGREPNVTGLRQVRLGLAGLWYNPLNLVTDPAALGLLAVETPSGKPVVTRPGFSSFLTKYTATVPAGVTTISVTPTAYWPAHKGIEVNGKPVKSGASVPLELGDGSTSIEVAVTSEKGSVRTYALVITRGGAATAK